MNVRSTIAKRSYATLASLTGALVLILVAAWSGSQRPTFRGFHVSRQTAGEPGVRFARSYAKVEFPDNGWRPAVVRVQVRAPDGRSGAPLTLSFDDVPLQQVTVGPRWETHEVVVTAPSRTPGTLALQLLTTVAAGSDDGVGVGPVSMRPELVAWRSVPWGAAGAVLGFLIFVASGGRQAAETGSGRRILGTAAAVMFLGICVATAGYADLGARLFSIVERTVSALGLDRVPGLLTVLITPATIFHVVVQVVLVTLPGWFLLTSVPRLRLRPGSDDDALQAMPLTVMLVGLVFIPLQWSGVPDRGFTLAFAAIYGGAAIGLAASPRKRSALAQFIVANRWFFALQILVALAALFYLSVGLQDTGRIVESYPGRRNPGELPADNLLGWGVSLTWSRHLHPDALQPVPWRMGDRGPLLAVLHSFFYRALDPGREYFPHYIRLAVVLQASFASALFVLLRRWSSAPVAWSCAALVALNPWTFMNVYYTWPKLFGAFFVIGAVALLWSKERPTAARFGWAGVLCGLGGLAHHGHILSIPCLFLFALVRRGLSIDTLMRSSAMVLGVVIAQVPWSIYKHLYSPETGRMVIEHYLGGKDYFQPLATRFYFFLEEFPWRAQVATRLENVERLWWIQLNWTLVQQWWQGRWATSEFMTRLYPYEFFHPLHSVGLLWLVWLPVAFAVNAVYAIAAHWRRIRWPPRVIAPFVASDRTDLSLGPALAVLAYAVVSLTVNVALRWKQPFTHELPYVEMLLIAAVGLYLLRYLGRFYLMVAALVILLRQEQYFRASAVVSALKLPALDANGLLFWVTCAVLVGGAFFVREPDPMAHQ